MQFTFVELNQSAFNHNIQQLHTLLHPSTFLACVIKANAYGHGIELIARWCQEAKAISMICVVSLSEAIYLRQLGIQKPMLVLNIIDEEISLAFQHDIQLAISDYETVQRLKKYRQLNTKLKIHLKIDTGLGRAGIEYEQAISLAHQIQQIKSIAFLGAFSHFIQPTNHDLLKHQLTLFKNFCGQAKQNNINVAYQHIANSTALLLEPTAHCNMVRTGICLYGIWPSVEIKKKMEEQHPFFSLQPVLSWKTIIIQIKKIAQGTSIGYEATFHAPKPMKIAILPIGYADGYDRRLSNKACVKIGNSYAPVIGLISMNLTIIDVTNIPDVYVGQEVILIGPDEPINPLTLANQIGTISHEIITNIRSGINRIITH